MSIEPTCGIPVLTSVSLTLTSVVRSYGPQRLGLTDPSRPWSPWSWPWPGIAPAERAWTVQAWPAAMPGTPALRRPVRAQTGRSATRVAPLERTGRRALEHFAVDVEARAVAGAVPADLRGVEAQEAAKVRAAQRHGVQRAGLVAIDTRLAQAVADDARLARRHGVGIALLGGPDAVADEVDGDPGVDASEAGHRAQGHARGVEGRAPRVVAAGDQVAEQDRGHRAAAEAPFHESRRRVEPRLAGSVGPDHGKVVVGDRVLRGPAMGDRCHVPVIAGEGFQRLEALRCGVR